MPGSNTFMFSKSSKLNNSGSSPGSRPLFTWMTKRLDLGVTLIQACFSNDITYLYVYLRVQSTKSTTLNHLRITRNLTLSFLLGNRVFLYKKKLQIAWTKIFQISPTNSRSLFIRFCSTFAADSTTRISGEKSKLKFTSCNIHIQVISHSSAYIWNCKTSLNAHNLSFSVEIKTTLS